MQQLQALPWARIYCEVDTGYSTPDISALIMLGGQAEQ
jgi:hypothetical protein